MSLKTYPVELPESAFSALRKSPTEFVEEMKYAAVVKRYEAGMISQDKAAEIAGLSRYAFLNLLGRYQVSAIQYTPELLEEELRPYQDERDLQSMQNILLEGKRAAGPAYYVHVGDLAWWLFYLDPDFRQRVYLWDNGSVLGWALFSPRFRAFDVFVHPDPALAEQRKRLFIWAEEQMNRLVREQGGHNLCTMWVSEHDSQLTAHLQARGFVASEYHMIYMQQSLAETIPEPQLPPGYCLRHVAGEHEAEQRARLAHAAFESGKSIERYIQDYVQFMRSPVYTPELDLVAVAPDGQFVAFCLCWLDPLNRLGYLEPVGTHPNFRQRGLGAAVLRQGLRRLHARGMQAASVCVESDNLAAQKLYQAVGFCQMHKIHTFVKKL